MIYINFVFFEKLPIDILPVTIALVETLAYKLYTCMCVLTTVYRSQF